MEKYAEAWQGEMVVGISVPTLEQCERYKDAHPPLPLGRLKDQQGRMRKRRTATKR